MYALVRNDSGGLCGKQSWECNGDLVYWREQAPPYKSVGESAPEAQMTLRHGKEILHIERKNMRKFVIFSEIMLDI